MTSCMRWNKQTTANARPTVFEFWTVGSYSIGEAQGRTLREALLKLKELER